MFKNTPFIVVTLLTVAVLFSLPVAVPAQPTDPLPTIDAAIQATIIDSLTTALDEVYIFADKAQEMDVYVRERLQDGAYEDLNSLPAFTQQLTEDLRSICHDRHLRVEAEGPLEAGDDEVSDEERRARYLARARRQNFQFEKIEILPGNIGYLKFNAFVAAEYGGATAVAAMNFLANSDALIIDLRENGGGSPSMIQLITSYFFEDPTHLNSFYIRKTDETKQFWTQAHVDGPRLTEVPIWVLTSSYTFSGAEEFTYNLKNLERATIVGETTGGGAHPVQGHYFDFGDFVVTMSLPFGRAINPITGTNWEGTGVEPDLAVSAEDALLTAQLEALIVLQEKAIDSVMQERIAWHLNGMKVQLEPVTLSSSDLKPFQGTYGPRKIWSDGDVLWYQREERPPYQLIPMGSDLFMLEGLDYFRILFERDENGNVVRLVGIYDNGRRDQNDRTSG